MASRSLSVLRSVARSSPRPAGIIGARGIATPASATEFTLSNADHAKVKVATAEDSSPTAAITVALKAGSRYEPAPGLAHLFKNSVFKSTDKRSTLRLVREAEILGGVLTSGLTREHLFLTAEFLRGDEGFFAELLGDAVTRARLVRHEFVEDAVPQAATEYAQAIQDPLVFGLDVAHQLAFRTGLGNSLFASPQTEVTWEELVAFAHQSFSSTSSIAVVGSGVSSKTLTSLVNEFFSRDASTPVSPAAPAQGKSEYFGGDVRVPATAHGLVRDHLLVGLKGGPISDPAYSVLAHYLGGAPSVKWTKGSTPFASLAVPGGSVRAFNVPYSDSGLVGFQVQAPTDKVQEIASKAVAEIKKVAEGVKEEDVKRAVAKAKFAIANTLESRTGKLELAGSQLSSGGSVTSLESAFQALDKVDAAALKKAAADALKSKATTVAIGNTHQLPFADSLGLSS